MTFLVTEACIKCKYQDCVDVCPVDCFYEGANMLVIDPEACIDCGICVPECPVAAIVADNEGDAEEKWLELNEKYTAVWPNIIKKGAPPSDAAEWDDVPDKLQYLDPTPAE